MNLMQEISSNSKETSIDSSGELKELNKASP